MAGCQNDGAVFGYLRRFAYLCAIFNLRGLLYGYRGCKIYDFFQQPAAWAGDVKMPFFLVFTHSNGCPVRKMRQKTHLFQKKSGKSFVVKKKAVHLHSLYNGNSATNDDRLFSSVGQST